ncbi:phage shock protein PspA [Thalassotalea aquiviva]|uniref:phage shock protein PspA n=1 Tax=Thalassotalea aquiviva TaxID=3242415 RepID=UPI003529E594
MGMFSRFTDIINANINSLLEKAENPEKMIRLIVQEMEETLVEVRSVAAKNIADKKAVTRTLKSAESQVADWQQKAEIALSKGREDLARSALVEKKKAMTLVNNTQQELDALNDILDKVQDDAGRLQTKLTEAKRRQESIRLRQQSATTRLKVKSQLHAVDVEESLQKFERYQQKVEQVEAQVEAWDITHKSDLMNEFDALENEDAIERELQAMKQNVANS